MLLTERRRRQFEQATRRRDAGELARGLGSVTRGVLPGRGLREYAFR